MKLKNNSIGPKVIHYVSSQGGRKAVTIETNETVEINDCAKIINEQEIEHKWVSIVDESNETNSIVNKMEEATKDVESYMSEETEETTEETEEISEETEEESENEKSSNNK